MDVPEPDVPPDQVGDGAVQWAMRGLPYYGRWYRFLVLWPGSDKGLDAAQGDPNYADQEHAVSDINAAAHMMFSQWITSQVGEDPNSQELLAKLLPDYPACGKRTLQDMAAGCKRCSAGASNWCAPRSSGSPPAVSSPRMV